MKLTSKMLKQMIAEELEEGLFDRLFGKEEKPQLTKDQILMQKDPTGRFKAISDYTKMSQGIRKQLKELIEIVRSDSDQSRHGTLIGTKKIERKYNCRRMMELRKFIIDKKDFLFWYFSKQGISAGEKMKLDRPHPVPPRPDATRQDPEKVGLDVWVLEIDAYFEALNEQGEKEGYRKCYTGAMSMLSGQIPSPQDLNTWAQKNISPFVLNPRMGAPKE